MGIKTSNFTDIHETDTDQTLPNRASIGLNTSRFSSVNQALYALRLRLRLRLWVKSIKMTWLCAVSIRQTLSSKHLFIIMIDGEWNGENGRS